MMYRTLLKTIRKMLNSLTLRQQHFLYQRKNLYDQESSRSSSGEIVPENLHENLQPEFFIFSPHRTLSEVAALPREKLRTTRSTGQWAPLQYKMEDERQKYAGREKLSIKISDTERYCRRYQEEGHSCAEDRKCLRGFRYDVQASCRHQAHCLRRRRVWATGGK